MSILYASFVSAHDAEKAAGALIDEGANASDVSFLTNEQYGAHRQGLVAHEEEQAKAGISTTTGADAAMGAAKGLTVGVGVGIAGALAALLVPGVGLVIGAGALATAFAGAAATAVAGAAAGGVVGYLKDQGMSERQISHYSEAVAGGGAILTLNIPSAKLPTSQAEGILLKYGATDVSTANPQPTMIGHEAPLVDEHGFPSTTAAIPPATETVAIPSTVENVIAAPVVTSTATSVADPLTGTVEPVIPVSSVRPTRIDPVTGTALEGYVVDSASGIERPVRVENGRVVYVI